MFFVMFASSVSRPKTDLHRELCAFVNDRHYSCVTRSLTTSVVAILCVLAARLPGEKGKQECLFICLEHSLDLYRSHSPVL